MADTFQDRVCVVLVAPRNPLNIGAVARAMSNFGFPCLRVVNPYAVAFREARSAVGAADLLVNAQEYTTLAAAVADCSLVLGTTAVGHRELRQPLYPIQHASLRIHAALGTEVVAAQNSNVKDASRVALLFGSEKFGLSNESMTHCHWLLHIPTCKENYSINLGQAAAICLYELSRGFAPIPADPLRPKAATFKELERLVDIFLQLLHASTYALGKPKENIEDQVRRLVLRLNPSNRDVKTLLGMLRKMLWKLEGTNNSKG